MRVVSYVGIESATKGLEESIIWLLVKELLKCEILFNRELGNYLKPKR